MCENAAFSLEDSTVLGRTPAIGTQLEILTDA